jgi:uncharacterized protein YbjQ (UPF0145 family)
MTNQPSSQFNQSQGSQTSQTSMASSDPIDGPVPLPEESPFLSDHGIGAANPPPTARMPVVPPSNLSQFPPTATAVSIPARTSIPEPPSNPPPGGGAVVQDGLSSFTLYGASDDPFGTARSTQSVPRVPQPGSPQAELLERLKSVQVTTTDSLQGRLVEQYLGTVTSEAIVPTDILMEGAERTGRFGRYKSSQQKLKSLEQLVLAEIKLEADKMGGNAVVGMELRVSMDHGVVLIVATGTAVRVN